LHHNKVKLTDLKEIKVKNTGESFTALRIGVITANALAYGLGIPVKPGTRDNPSTLRQAQPSGFAKSKKYKNFSVVAPVYDREPNIG